MQMGEGRLSEVEALLAVVDAGSFSEAARSLGLTQSTISRRVSQLEARLGTRLIARTTRSMSMTSAGEAFMIQARHALQLLNAAEADLDTSATQVAGLVRMTAPTAFGRACVIPALNSMVEAHPHLRIDLELSDRYVDLHAGRIDLAVRFSDLVPSGWTCQTLGQIEGRLCASPAYLRRHGTPESIDELTSHRLLTAKTYTARTRWPFDVNGVVRNIDIDPVITVSDFTALTDMVLAGAGISILPSFLADDLINRQQIVEIIEHKSSFSACICATNPKHLAKAARVQVIIDRIKFCMTEKISLT